MLHLANVLLQLSATNKHDALLRQHFCFLRPRLGEEASMHTRRARILRIILTLFLTLLLLILAQTMQAADQTTHGMVGIVQQLTDALSGDGSMP